MASNPLFVASSLPYQAPEFSKIKFEHFKPAFEKGIEEQLHEIEAIKGNKDAPTFENTVVALERSGQLLQRAMAVFFNLCHANTSPEMQDLQQEYAPKFAAHTDQINLDSKLYARVKAVYDGRSSLAGEDLRMIEHLNQTFSIAGAQLDESKKEELKQLNGRLASLESSFGNKLLEIRKSGGVVFESEAELKGLKEDDVNAAREEAEKRGLKGKFVLSLFNTTQQPLMESMEVRDSRRRLLEASLVRGEGGDACDTQAIVTELVRLRLQKAQLLGQKCFTDWKLLDQMADRESANALIRDVVAAGVGRAKEEAADIQKILATEQKGATMEAWDWAYYAERVRKEKFDLDENEVKPYFELFSVLERGAFYVAEHLYGVSFKKRTDLPSYDPDVVCYEVFDHSGTALAVFFFDPFTRPNKSGGAWMTNFVEQSTLLQQKPVVYNVLNVVKPPKGKPALISSDDVRTVFHEFGHALHGIFSNVKYPTLSGANVARDFVEFPSQINEKWALNIEVLKNYALHYETHEVIPQSLVDKIKASATYGSGFHCVELMKATVIDLYWHNTTEEKGFLEPAKMEDAALAAYGLDGFAAVPPRYRSTYFSHIFQGGYASGYYAYTWAKVLDCDGFEWFTSSGGLLRANGDKFREYVLSKGNSVDLNAAYVALTGRKPSIGAYLRDHGFPEK